MQVKNYYQIMGIDESASAADIKKAYRKLARRYHPDVSKLKDAEQKFKDLGEAYEVLKDESKRQQYDQIKAGNNSNTHFTPPPNWQKKTHFTDDNINPDDLNDIFSDIFGKNSNSHHQANTSSEEFHAHQYNLRGKDLYHDLPIFLEESISGTEKLIELSSPEVDQHGLVNYRLHKLKVKIPKGCKNGQHLKIKGKGATGLGEAESGDLILIIKIAPHPLYTVEGKDLTLVMPITPWEAALGDKIAIATLLGRMKVTIPAMTQTGFKLRLPGKGLPGNPAGDLFLLIKVTMPNQETEKSRELFTQLAKEVPFNPRTD